MTPAEALRAAHDLLDSPETHLPFGRHYCSGA